jgi:acyl-CoA synthetase (AMP-forming)/AMP-acid ligase II
VESAERLAKSWLARGLLPGDRIALHLRNGSPLATCYYACFAAGFIAVPINNRLTPEEIAYVLADSGAKAYLAEPDLRIGVAISSWEFDLSARDYLEQGELREADPDAPALLLYTSGTTARPKGVIHTQRTLAGNASYMGAWEFTESDHTLLFTSMAHASGAIMLLMSSLWMGATVTIVPVFEAGVVLDTRARSGATFFFWPCRLWPSSAGSPGKSPPAVWQSVEATLCPSPCSRNMPMCLDTPWWKASA